jgi:hypothetical protein
LVSPKLTSDRPVTPPGVSREFVGEQTLEARLWEDPFKSADQDKQHGGVPIATNFNPLIEQIRERSESANSVLMLPVMISGGEYSEDHESRIRSRFAIVSALSRSGYAPDDAEHLGAVRIPWPTQNEVDRAKKRTNCFLPKLWGQYCPTDTDTCFACTNFLCPLGLNTSFHMDVHYEWYRRRTFFPNPYSGPPHVLVLWLDDSFFEDEPLLRLPLLLEPLLLANGLTNVALIGPRRSSTLRAMLPGQFPGTRPLRDANPDLWMLATNVLRHVEIYCATPTAMDEVLVTNFNDMPRQLVGDALLTNGFQAFHNFVATDAQLAQEVIDELALRRVDLKKTNENHLVLISEWDTFYARMLSLTYGAEMAVRQATNPISRYEFVHDYMDRKRDLPTNFHSFVYLRGLDGQTIGGNPNAKAATDSPTKSPTTSFEELRKWAPLANKAEGQAQFDYLVRLGDQLKELEDRLRRENGRARIAVGIVGSDVYDTLLILQALRERFPNFLFFTTDLDARFWHPREREWSRNLIVTSAYGLMLHPDLQREIAPFRDSTQTAQFAAALAALGNTNLTCLTNIPPRRFEIGNHGPVDLSVKPGLLLATNFVAHTNAAPWLHPLTAQQSYQANAQKMSWTNTFRLCRGLMNLKSKPDQRTRSENSKAKLHDPSKEPESNSAARTTCDYATLRLLGLGLILAFACVFWRPLRARTFGLFQFPVEVLRYDESDVGEPDDFVRLLKDLHSNPHPLCKWMGRQWARDYRDIFRLKKNEPIPAAERRQRRADAFIELLNRMVRREVLVDKDVARTNGFVPAETERACPWENSALAEHRLGRIGQRAENRRFLDALLDKLTPKPADENQLSAPTSARAAARKLFRLRVWKVVGFWAGTVLIVGLSSWIGSEIWNDISTRPDGEPFSLTNGISGWPAILLRLAAVVLSVFFCFTLYSQMRVMFYDLTRLYRFRLEGKTPWLYARQQAGKLWSSYRQKNRLPRIEGAARVAVDFVRNWVGGHCFPFRHVASGHSGRVCADTLWHRYSEGGHPLGRILRASVPCVIYFLLASVIYQLFGLPFQPLRGESHHAIFDWAAFKSPLKGYAITNLSFFFLIFLTIDAARLCRGFIQKLSAGNVELSSATRAHFRRHRGDVPPECLDDWIGTRLIADLTERVGKLLWFPAIVLLLLLMARFEVWDHWPWHTAHIIIMTLNFCLALASVAILQHAARDAKRAAEERLTAKVKRLQAKAAPSAAQNAAAQAENLLKEIREIRHGAFGSIWENPVLGAVLLGPGGLTTLQMLIWFMGR